MLKCLSLLFWYILFTLDNIHSKSKEKKYFHSFILTQGQHSVYPFKIKICTRKSQHIAHNLFCLASGIKFFD